MLMKLFYIHWINMIMTSMENSFGMRSQQSALVLVQILCKFRYCVWVSCLICKMRIWDQMISGSLTNLKYH